MKKWLLLALLAMLSGCKTFDVARDYIDRLDPISSPNKDQSIDDGQENPQAQLPPGQIPQSPEVSSGHDDIAGDPGSALNHHPLQNLYPPRSPNYSRSSRIAAANTSLEWIALGSGGQAKYIHSIYETLNKLHGLNYDPMVLTCKAFKESGGRVRNTLIFRTQNMSSVKKRGRYISSAAGIPQVTKSTAGDLFDRDPWFRSKVPGFENIRDGRLFHKRAAGNIVAQIELGYAVFHQKSRDTGRKNLRSIMSAYYGHPWQSCRNSYVGKVFNCVRCVKKSGYTQSCLAKALGTKKGCW